MSALHCFRLISYSLFELSRNPLNLEQILQVTAAASSKIKVVRTEDWVAGNLSVSRVYMRKINKAAT